MTETLKALSAEEREHISEESMPDWLDPMLARLTHDYFSDEDWVFERKLDGERVIAFCSQSSGIVLKSRNKKVLNQNYPEIEQALEESIKADCILDGELVALDQNNVSDFQRLQPRMQASSKEESQASHVAVYYYVFDCLYLDGYRVTECSLRTRKKLLKSSNHWEDPLRWLPHRNEDGIEYYREACEKGWEGIIARRLTPPIPLFSPVGVARRWRHCPDKAREPQRLELSQT